MCEILGEKGGDEICPLLLLLPYNTHGRGIRRGGEVSNKFSTKHPPPSPSTRPRYPAYLPSTHPLSIPSLTPIHTDYPPPPPPSEMLM
jgi:hypothetical protein